MPVPTERGTDRARRTAADRRLLRRYREHGDVAARDELVARLMPLARQLALRYRRTSEPLDDLLQVASVGLVKAVERFDPARGVALSTYAVPTILGELRRYFRDATWSVRVSREIQERVLRLERHTRLLANQLGRAPSVPELAADLGLTDEEVLAAIEAGGAYRAASLDEHLERPDGEGEPLRDMLGAEDARFELVEDAATLGEALGVLDQRSRRVLQLRFAEDMTQSEIGAALGISQMHVSRLLRRAIATLRDQTAVEAAA